MYERSACLWGIFLGKPKFMCCIDSTAVVVGHLESTFSHLFPSSEASLGKVSLPDCSDFPILQCSLSYFSFLQSYEK